MLLFIRLDPLCKKLKNKKNSTNVLLIQKKQYICTGINIITVKVVKSKFSISLHIMTLLAYYPKEWHSSSAIAKSLNINPVLVRNELKALKEGGLIESKEGKNGGIKLGKAAANISLADIFEAIKGDSHVLNLSSNIPNANCKIGHQINDKLLSIFDNVDTAITNLLKKQTLETFKNQF